MSHSEPNAALKGPLFHGDADEGEDTQTSDGETKRFCKRLKEEAWSLNGFDKAGQQQGAARQFRNDDVLVNCVGAFTNGAETVERGDADAGGKVSIGAAAYGGFFQLPVDLFRDGLRLFVESCYAGVALHGQAVDAAFDVEFATFVERLEGVKFTIEAGGLLGALDAHVDFGDGFGGDHVGARASADDSWIH